MHSKTQYTGLTKGEFVETSLLCVLMTKKMSTLTLFTLMLDMTLWGCTRDLVKWWPKLKKGGIFAGHDYVTQDDGPAQTRQDWTTNFDGTKDESGTVVKGAVDKFATEVCRQVTVSYRESGWNTWAMRK